MITKNKIISESYFSGVDTEEVSGDIELQWEHCLEIKHPETYLNPKWGDNNNVLRKIPVMIDYICEKASFIEEYRFVYVPDDSPEIDDIDKIIEVLRKEFKEYVKPDKSIYYDHMIMGTFKIYFNFKQGIQEDKLFIMFIGFVQKLYSMNNSKRLLLSIPIFVDGECANETSWLYGNIAARNIFRKITRNEEFDTEDTKASNYPELKWTGSECTLSSESEKSLKRFGKFNFLFCRRDGALVSQEKNEDGSLNTPIAFFSHIGSDGYGRFCSLRYLTSHNTKYGAILASQNIRFGNFNNEELPSTSNEIDGAANTQMLYDIVNKNAREKGVFDITWKSGTLKNDDKDGHYPLLLACYLFRTPGTKPGQWYIPSSTELMMAFSKKKKVDENTYKRYAIYNVSISNAVDILNNKECGLNISKESQGEMLQIYGKMSFWSSNVSLKEKEHVYYNTICSFSDVLTIDRKKIMCEDNETTDTGISGIAFLKIKDKK